MPLYRAKPTKLMTVALIPDEARPPIQLGACLKSSVSSVLAKAGASLSALDLYKFTHTYAHIYIYTYICILYP